MIWWFYRALKDYKLAPSVKQAQLLRARFDRIFKRASTGYTTLDRLLRRLFRNKEGLLRVLERPEIPINTNASENDIRAFVTKRKISGGTVSDKGRDARDIMLGLAKTCTGLSSIRSFGGSCRTGSRPIGMSAHWGLERKRQAFLAGLIVDAEGERMTPTHATKRARRYPPSFWLAIASNRSKGCGSRRAISRGWR